MNRTNIHKYDWMVPVDEMPEGVVMAVNWPGIRRELEKGKTFEEALTGNVGQFRLAAYEPDEYSQG